jgi:hypothetical protein
VLQRLLFRALVALLATLSMPARGQTLPVRVCAPTSTAHFMSMCLSWNMQIQIQNILVTLDVTARLQVCEFVAGDPVTYTSPTSPTSIAVTTVQTPAAYLSGCAYVLVSVTVGAQLVPKFGEQVPESSLKFNGARRVVCAVRDGGTILTARTWVRPGCSASSKASPATVLAGKPGYSSCVFVSAATTPTAVPGLTVTVGAGTRMVAGLCAIIVAPAGTITITLMSGTGTMDCQPVVSSTGDCSFSTPCTLSGGASGSSHGISVAASNSGMVVNLVAATAGCPGDGNCGGHGTCTLATSSTGATASCVCAGRWTGPMCQTSPSACTGSVTLSATSGYFESNPAGTLYRASSACTWIVTLPSFMVVSFSFTRFHTLDASDYLHVTSAAGGGTAFSQVFVGAYATLPPLVVSPVSTLVFAFNSGAAQFDGFGVKYTGVQAACNATGLPATIAAQLAGMNSGISGGVAPACGVMSMRGAPAVYDVSPAAYVPALVHAWVAVCSASYFPGALFRSRLFSVAGHNTSMPGGNTGGLTLLSCPGGATSFSSGVCSKSLLCPVYPSSPITVYAMLERGPNSTQPLSAEYLFAVLACPTAVESTECSGHGTCVLPVSSSSPYPSCTCSAGYTDAACSTLLAYCAPQTAVSTTSGTISDGAAAHGSGTRYRKSTKVRAAGAACVCFGCTHKG